MLLDVSNIVPEYYFDAKSYPVIQRYTQTKSNWLSLDKGSMKMKPFRSHIRARNDPNFTNTHLLLKEEPATDCLLCAIDHVLTKHANKPSIVTQHSVKIYDADIPSSFIKTVKQQ